MATRAGLDAETIIQKAAELADKDGFEELTMATLASHLGVRTPALYHYFAGLSGLRRALAISGLRKMSTELGRVVMGKAGDDAVIALAYALRSFVKEHPGIYKATVRSAEGEDSEWQAAGSEVVEVGLLALSSYHLSTDDALHAVRMLRSIVHGCASLEIAGGFGLPLDVDETFHRLIVAFLNYLHNELKREEA